MLAKALLTKLGGNKALGNELLKLGKESAREEEASGKLKGADKLLKRAGKPVRELLKPVDKAPKLLGRELKGNKEGIKKEGILEETLGREEAALLLAKDKLTKAEDPKLLAGKELNPALGKEPLAAIAEGIPKLLLGPTLKLDNGAKERGSPLRLREDAASEDELVARGNRLEANRLLDNAKIALKLALGNKVEAKGIKIEGKLSKGNKLEELLKADTKLGKKDKVGKEARDSANGVLAKELLKGELLMAPLLDKVSALDKDRLAKGKLKPALEDKGTPLLKEGNTENRLESAGGRLLNPKENEGILDTKLEKTAGAEINKGEDKELANAPKLIAGKDKLLLKKSGKDKEEGLKEEIKDKLLLTGIKLALAKLKAEGAKLLFKSALKLLLKAKGKLLNALLKNGPEDTLLAKAVGALKLLLNKLGNGSTRELKALLKGREAKLLERVDKLLSIGPNKLKELEGKEEMVLKAPILGGKEAKTVLNEARLAGVTPPIREEEALGKVLESKDKFNAKLIQEGKKPNKLLLAAIALKLRKAKEEAELKEGKAKAPAKLVKPTLEEDPIGREGKLLKLTGNKEDDNKGAKLNLGPLKKAALKTFAASSKVQVHH